MSLQITCSFTIEKWDETPFSQSDNGPKLNRASVKQSYSGSLEAKSTIEYLMISFDNGSSTFIGIEEISGTLEGRSGSFLLNHKGKHEDGVAASTFEIVPGSGTDELRRIHGKGKYEATHDKTFFTLDYGFEEEK